MHELSVSLMGHSVKGSKISGYPLTCKVKLYCNRKKRQMDTGKRRGRRPLGSALLTGDTRAEEFSKVSRDF